MKGFCGRLLCDQIMSYHDINAEWTLIIYVYEKFFYKFNVFNEKTFYKTFFVLIQLYINVGKKVVYLFIV